jgi:hypothetical protein
MSSWPGFRQKGRDDLRVLCIPRAWRVYIQVQLYFYSACEDATAERTLHLQTQSAGPPVQSTPSDIFPRALGKMMHRKAPASELHTVGAYIHG